MMQPASALRTAQSRMQSKNACWTLRHSCWMEHSTERGNLSLTASPYSSGIIPMQPSLQQENSMSTPMVMGHTARSLAMGHSRAMVHSVAQWSAKEHSTCLARYPETMRWKYCSIPASLSKLTPHSQYRAHQHLEHDRLMYREFC